MRRVTQSSFTSIIDAPGLLLLQDSFISPGTAVFRHFLRLWLSPASTHRHVLLIAFENAPEYYLPRLSPVSTLGEKTTLALIDAYSDPMGWNADVADDDAVHAHAPAPAPAQPAQQHRVLRDLSSLSLLETQIGELLSETQQHHSVAIAIDSLSPLLRYHATSAVCSFLARLLRVSPPRSVSSTSSGSTSSSTPGSCVKSVLFTLHVDHYTACSSACSPGAVGQSSPSLLSLQHVAQLHIAVSKPLIIFADESETEVADGVLKVLQKRSKSGKVVRFGEEFKLVRVTPPPPSETSSSPLTSSSSCFSDRSTTAPPPLLPEYHLKIIRRKRAPKAASTAAQALRANEKKNSASSSSSSSAGGAMGDGSAEASTLSDLTFNLSLTESERAARAKVSLPHQFHLRGKTSAVQQAPNIYYDANDAEFDDDDPDDDLDI